tara:strand:+ start:2431 stop:3639 length:1209 start_codon:yes stop_codon:yes gene_type:complete
MNKNKILFLTNYYSALQESIINNNWNPKGMPAIYRLLEFLEDKKESFDYIFVDKKTKNDKIFKETIHLDRFQNSSLSILRLDKKKSILKIFDQYFFYKKVSNFLINNYNLNNYDVIYIDRGNVCLIPFIKKIFNGKIILRLHGILNYHELFINSLKFKFLSWFLIYSFKQKVDYVICSKDGSPTNFFLNHCINKKSPHTTLINGVDNYASTNKINKSKISYLFLGRLEKDKGIVEVINVFKKLIANYSDKIDLTIIGDGSLYTDISEKVSNINNITIYKSLPHSKIKNIFLDVDVLLSLNYIGNISNVVLEAISAEKAIISFKHNPVNLEDIESYDFLQNNAMYIDRNKIFEDLYELIVSNIEDSSIIDNYKTLTKIKLKPKLISWDERINIEYKIIKSNYK